jgi:hypothetical protein
MRSGLTCLEIPCDARPANIRRTYTGELISTVTFGKWRAEMISGWVERVAWSKDNRWAMNEITRKLLDLFDEDIAIMIWDQYGNNSIKMLDGILDREALTLCGKFKYFFKIKKFVSPLEKIKQKLKTEDGRREIELWLLNPWAS